MVDTIYLGADHAGFWLKNYFHNYLKRKGYDVEDMGAFELDSKDDYPDYAIRVARMVAVRKARGILFCGSGQGMCIAANKVRGIRAVTARNVPEARLTRSHNDANILCLSGWDTSKDEAARIVNAWLNTKFTKVTRHVRRINKISRIER